MSPVKEQLIRLIEDQPDDSSHEEILRELAFAAMVERGVADSDAGPGGWWILDEPELHIDQNALVPDLAGWRVETMPELPETAFFPVRPDWVCEVLSESTAVMDRSLKMPIYARAQVLEQFPKLGQIYRTQSGRDARILLWGHYRIVYLQPNDDEVHIVGVFHGAMELDHYLK